MILAAAFVAFGIMCAVLAFARHPIWGVYFYLATTFVYPPGRWWGYVFGDLRWALIAAGVTAAAIVFHRGKLNRKPLWLGWGSALCLALYAGWMVVQQAWALDPDSHWRGTIEFIKCLLALWFVYRALDSKERVRDLMLAHVLGCALLGLFALQTGRTEGRLDGVGGPNLDDSNSLAMYLVTAAITAVGLVMTQKGWRRIVPLLCLPVIVNGFVLANSRGAFLGLVGGALVLALLTAKRHRWVLATFAVVGAVGLLVLVDRTFVERMFTIGDVTSQDEDADSSARSRMVIAKAQIEMFFRYPMGTGWRGTAVLSPRYMDDRWLAQDAGGGARSRSSHSTYLTALTEQGIPGALIYFCLLVWVIVAATRIYRISRTGPDAELATLGAALLGATSVVLVSGMTADNLTKEVQFWLYAGLTSILWLSESVPRAPIGEATSLRQARLESARR